MCAACTALDQRELTSAIESDVLSCNEGRLMHVRPLAPLAVLTLQLLAVHPWSAARSIRDKM